ncbi:MAG: hypothetical protein LBU65_12525 [Planctomycetaceae bacterium]|jgi:hypothetical protein|nr:hypothetical protein [Planctomycetaceae bacterium]
MTNIDESDVKLRERQDNKTWLRRWSPFAFGTLKEVPLPNLSLIFALFFFLILVAGLVVDKSSPVSAVLLRDLESGEIQKFVQTERSKNPKHPQIVVAGSSMLMGIHTNELQKRTGMNVAKMMLLGGNVTEVHKLMQMFSEELSSAKVFFLELAPERLGLRNGAGYVRPALKRYCDWNEKSDILFHPPRISVADLFKNKKHITLEDRWLDPNDRARWKLDVDIVTIPPVGTSKEWCGKPDDVDNYHAYHGENDPQQFQAVHNILKLCRERAMFLVVFVTPQWYGQLNLSQHDLEIPPVNDYIALLQELKRQPNCEVVVCDDFTDITSEGTDADYLFDYGHMTEKGAKVYTNWLIERLLEKPKFTTVLRSLRSEEQPVMVATPVTESNVR